MKNIILGTSYVISLGGAFAIGCVAGGGWVLLRVSEALKAPSKRSYPRRNQRYAPSYFKDQEDE